MNAQRIGASTLIRRTRAAAIAAVATLVLLPAAVAAGKPSSGACVVDAAGATFASVQAALDASPAGVKVRVSGTCVGPTTVSKDASISGPGGNGPGATLDGGGAASSSFDSVLTIEAGVTVTVERLRLTNGYNIAGGGGIRNEGTLVMRHSTVVDNASDTGGGIANYSNATIIDSLIDHNGNRLGGNVYNEGTLVIRGSPLSRGGGRFGNGLYNAGTATLVDTEVIDDDLVLPLFGGGIENHGDLTLRRSTISGNTSVFGGGLLNTGVARLVGSTVTDNSGTTGGGIINGPAFEPGSGSEQLILIDSKVGGNTADAGGGIYNKGRVLLDGRSRVGGNTATGGQGGGIYNDPGATVSGITGGTFTPPNTPDDCFGCP